MEITRRGFMAGAAVVGAGLVLLGTETAAEAADGPPSLPAGLSVYREVYANWDGTVRTAGLWTCAVKTPADVVALANWARAQSWSLRARGGRHSWSPLTVADGVAADARILIVDATKGLTAMRMDGTKLVVQTGAMMDAVAPFLAGRGRGFTNMPAPGDITVGGMLAVGAHGTSVPAAGEVAPEGANFGSMSNTVLSLTAVVWNATTKAYELRTFDRAHADIGPLLVYLGRVFIVEVTMRTQVAQNWRCRTYTDIPTSELFAAPEKAGNRSLSTLIDQAGRVGVIWYTHTSFPWVQRWDVTPQRPLLSRQTYAPYNFPFADRYPRAVMELMEDIVAGHEAVAPAFGKAVLAATATGLTATAARDMWGPAYHFQHFVKPTTLQVMAASHALLIARRDLQRVVNKYTTFVTELINRYAAKGRYPLNSCVELRVTRVDDPRVTGVAGAQVATLSASAPDPRFPGRDTVIWLDTLSIAKTKGTADFFAELEAWMVKELTQIGTLRPEWAKRFAHTPDGAWKNTEDLTVRIPSAISGFAAAQQTFARLDPHGVFGSELVDALRL